MNELIQVAESIAREAKRVEHFVKAAEVLRRIGSLDQAEQESKERAAKAKLEAEEAASRLAALNAATGKVQEEVNELVANGRAQVVEMRNAATKEAQEIVQGARMRADEVMAKAKADAERMAEAAIAAVARANAEKQEAEKMRAALQDGIDRGQVELHAVEEKLAKAREEIKRLLG